MRDRLTDLGDTAVAVVTFATPERVAASHRALLAPLTLLVDEERDTYRGFGLGRGSVWKVWGPKVWAEYLRLIRRGRRPQRTHEDTLQLGGDVVVDRRGRIAFLYRSDDPTDRPTIVALIAVIRTL